MPDLILGLFTWTHVTRVQTQEIEEKEALEGEGTQKEIAQESSPEETAQKEVAQESAPEETNQKEVAQESSPEESTQKEIAQKEASEEKVAEGNILIFFKKIIFSFFGPEKPSKTRANAKILKNILLISPDFFLFSKSNFFSFLKCT